jgi:phosphoglycerol transferase MdoB-like AlkP superfamily enzyme
MAVEEVFLDCIAAAVCALASSVAIEAALSPRPALRRATAAWALHAGCVLLAHATLVFVTGRPWFAATFTAALLLILVQVNNAKTRALREPFVFQDYEYFTDAIRHPRLYIPFLGWGKFLAAVAGAALAIAIGLWGEAPLAARTAGSARSWAAAMLLAIGVALCAGAWRARPSVSLDPARDLRTHGFVSSILLYAVADRTLPATASDFPAPAISRPLATLPHLVAVQSESFFDPRPLHPAIRPDVLAAFDRLKADGVAHGKLRVPAWGANTVRTEFAFLSGLPEAALGVHRFNPYRAVAAGWQPPSLARVLKTRGYRTICVHPYPSSFYRRDRVYPRLGFDAFLDLRDFAGAARAGPFVADAAVAARIDALLRDADAPLFIFAITMENHGPLHLERVAEADLEAAYRTPPPQGFEDLTIYLRHLRNADRMIDALRTSLGRACRPGQLCWFGDHVPIMPQVYAACGDPSGDVDYALWRSDGVRPARRQDLTAPELSAAWVVGA